MPKHFTLGKEERLKSRKHIEQLFSKGKRFVVNPLRILYLISLVKPEEKNQSTLSFGTGVSTRNFKKAKDRNRIKRLIKEAWRLQKNELKSKLKATNLQMNVFIIYTGEELPEFTAVKEKMNTVLKKLLEKKDEDTSANT